tara:strand:- start:79 stop:312 length:234 start_codon:yes stop_codon:yes gene_type:complete
MSKPTINFNHPIADEYFYLSRHNVGFGLSTIEQDEVLDDYYSGRLTSNPAQNKIMQKSRFEALKHALILMGTNGQGG